MIQIDRAGKFRGPIIEYGLERSKEGAWAVVLKIAIHEWLSGTNEWEDWQAYNFCVYARVYFIKKDGRPNEKGVEMLRDTLGWDGDPYSIERKLWQPPACQVLVKANEYNGQTSYRGEWIDPYDYEGSGVGQASPEDVAALATTHGSQLRAMFGTKPVTAPPPTGKPASPTPPTAPKPPAAPQSTPGTVPHGTKARAWAEWVAWNNRLPDPLSEEQLTKGWHSVYAMWFADREEKTLTSKEWLQMETQGPAAIPPF